jgi:hypothetical protein
LADKKSRVIVDNKWIPGVGKFQKNNNLTRKANFVGKIQGSVVENPNAFRQNAVSSFVVPNTTWGSEIGATGYARLQSLDASALNYSVNTAGAFVQQTMQFDLIAEIERNMGIIPGVDKTAKNQWLKSNILQVRANCHAQGSSPTGNKATLYVWSPSGSVWNPMSSNTTGSIANVTGMFTDGNTPISSMVDGLVYFLIAAEPSDGVTASTLNTDFGNHY